MKKKLIALLCALSLLGCARAETAPLPTPVPEATTEPSAAQTAAEGQMTIALDGAPLTLEFDPDPLFSVCRDGYIQASFFAYDESDMLYELYMTFPQNVQSGGSVTAESSLTGGYIASGLMLYISSSASETCAGATQYLTGPYPAGSSYEIRFSEVSVDGTKHTFAGSAEAKLVQIDENYNPTSVVNDFSAEFRFTMNIGAALPESSAAPEATLPPAEDSQPKEEEIPGYELPALPEPQRPPTPPAHLVTPSNARKI